MGARDKKKKKPEGLEDKQVDVDDVDETTRRKKQKTTEIQQEEEEEEEEEEDESFDSDDFEDSEDDFEDGGENEKLEDEDEEDVETSFEFFDPSEGDFLGMKGLLNAYLDGETYDASGLVDEIIKQKTVGSVVRLEEQLDPIAVVSVMNLKKHEHKQFLVDVVNFVCANAPTEKDRERMKMVVLDGKTKHRHGLVVSERVVNTPLELSSPLQQAIFDEIDWATEDEPTEEKRDEYKFTHFLMLTRVYHSDGGKGKGKGDKTNKNKNKNKKEKGQGQDGAGDTVVYVRPEDQFFHTECEWSFTFPAKHVHDIEGLQQQRLVMWISKQSVRKARQSLDSLFGKYLPAC